MLTIEYFVPMKKKEVIYVFTNMERFLVKKKQGAEQNTCLILFDEKKTYTHTLYIHTHTLMYIDTHMYTHI